MFEQPLPSGDEEVKAIKEKEMERGNWWNNIDPKIRVFILIFAGFLFYWVYLKGQSLRNALVLGGLVFLIIWLLLARKEPSVIGLTGEQAKLVTIEMIKRDINRGWLPRGLRYFPISCSECIHMFGEKWGYIVGFKFIYPSGKIDYKEFSVEFLPPGNPCMQTPEWIPKGYGKPHVDWILPTKIEKAKEAGFQRWYY